MSSTRLVMGRRRLQYEMSEEAYNQVKTLQKRAGADSTAKLVRDALRLYGWFLDQYDRGAKIQIVTDTERLQVELLL